MVTRWPHTLGCRTTTTPGLWADRRTRHAAEVFASGTAVPGGVAAVAVSAAAVGAAVGGAAVAVAGCGDAAGVGSDCDGGTERRRTAGARAGTGCTRGRPRTRSCADKRRRRRISRAAVPSVRAPTSPASSSLCIAASAAETAAVVAVLPLSATAPQRWRVGGRRSWTAVAGTTALFRRSGPAASIFPRRSGRPTAAAVRSARLPSVPLIRRVPPPLPKQRIRSLSSRSSPAGPPPSRNRPIPSARSLLLSSFEFLRCDVSGRYAYVICCKTKT